MRKILLFAIVFGSFLNHSVAQRTDEWKVGQFDKIKAGGGVEVLLVEGKAGIVKIDYDGIDADDIVVENRGRTLLIRLRNHVHLNDKRYRWNVRAVVPVETVEEISVTTGAVLNSKKLLTGRNIYIHANTGGEIDLEVNVENLEIKTSTGGIVKINGEAEELRTKATMGGEIDAFYLKSRYAYAKASMGGVIDIYAKEEAEIVATMGGEIDVRGNPRYLSTNSGLGGEIRPRH